MESGATLSRASLEGQSDVGPLNMTPASPRTVPCQKPAACQRPSALILPAIRALPATLPRAHFGHWTFGTNLLRTRMHVGPLAPSFSLLHSGEIGAVPVIRIFSHLHASRCAGAGAGSKSWPSRMILSDLEFISQQILIAEQHAAGTDLTTLMPNSFVTVRAAHRRWIAQQPLPGTGRIRGRRQHVPAADGSLLPRCAGGLLR